MLKRLKIEGIGTEISKGGIRFRMQGATRQKKSASIRLEKYEHKREVMSKKNKLKGGRIFIENGLI